MDNLIEAYKLLDTIKDSNDQNKIKEVAKLAFATSDKCFEAAIILSKLNDDFKEKEEILLISLKVNENNEQLYLELASLYFDYGMFKLAKQYYLRIENNALAKCRLMTIYAFFEDDCADEFYQQNTNASDPIDFVRMSFPYMFYKYKTNNVKEVKELLDKIIKINPYIFKIIMSEKIEDENNEEVKEAYKVFRNNAVLINSSPYSVLYLVSLC